MKTIEQWLNELPEPYRSQALDNTDNGVESLGSESLYDALEHAFVWSETKQGFNYWYEFQYSSFYNTPPH